MNLSYSQVTVTSAYHEGLATYKNTDGKKALYGFVNPKQKVVITAQYDSVYHLFKNGLAVVSKNFKAGVINKKGKAIIPFEYNTIGEITKGIIPVETFAGLWGFYDESGKLLSIPLYQNFRLGDGNKILVQKDCKWGIINTKGEVLMEFSYRWIDQINERKVKVYYPNKWSVRGTSNRIYSEVNYDSISNAGQGFFRYSIIGKFGLMDLNGKVIIDPTYDEIGEFRNSLVVVRKDKFGVIDKLNKTIIPFEYDEIAIDSLFIRVKVNKHNKDKSISEKWGLFDLKGNMLINPRYAKMNAWSEGLIAVMKDDGTWGYVNQKGENHIIFRYAAAESFHNGVAKVSVPYYVLKENHPAIINKSGDYVVSPADYKFYTSGLLKLDKIGKASFAFPKERYSWYHKINEHYFRVEEKGKYGILDSKGKEVIPILYDYVSDPSDNGLFVVQKDGKSGVIDSHGKFTFKLNNRYDKIEGFSEGFSKILLKGKFGVIDKLGDVYISAQYPAMGEMHDSMICVVLREKWAFVDYKENLKVQPYYEEVKSFKNGVALVKENGKWNIVNRQGKLLHLNNFDRIEKTKEGYYLLVSGSKMGLADRGGREILSPRYENVKVLSADYFMVRKNGLWGVLDMNENFILPIEFETISFDPILKVFVTGNIGRQEDKIVK